MVPLSRRKIESGDDISRTGHFAVAGGTTQPSGMEMQSPAPDTFGYKLEGAARQRLCKSIPHRGGGAPANWVVAMRRAAGRPVAHVGSRFTLASLPRIWRSLPHPSTVIFHRFPLLTQKTRIPPTVWHFTYSYAIPPTRADEGVT